MEAHYGLITAIQQHPHSSNKYKNLVLTSSLDWTVKLWSLTDLTQPMYEFFSPTCDYVCDVQWSPAHPAVFITISSSGKLCLWNLCKSTTEPVDILSVLKDSEEINPNQSFSGSVITAAGGTTSSKNPQVAVNTYTNKMVGGQAVALNKAVWSKDGQFLLVGDSMGVLHRLKVHQSHIVPTMADENKLEMVLMTAVNRSEENDVKKEGATGLRSKMAEQSITEDLDEDIEVFDVDKSEL